MRTVLLMSRGLRLGPLYAAIARELSRDHRVVALIDEAERSIWADVPGVDALTLQEAAAGETWPAPQERTAFVARVEAETGLRAYQAARNYLLYGRLHSELFGWRDRPWLWQDESAIFDDYILAYLAFRKLLQRNVRR